MFKNDRNYYAGTNEVHRYGSKAREKAARALIANENGYLSIPTDGGKYWTIGTSNGKYGEFANMCGTIFSVNRGGFAYAKAGTEKGEKFIEAVNNLIAKMNEMNEERLAAMMSDDEDED